MRGHACRLRVQWRGPVPRVRGGTDMGEHMRGAVQRQALHYPWRVPVQPPGRFLCRHRQRPEWRCTPFHFWQLSTIVGSVFGVWLELTAVACGPGRLEP